jgi:hypothetical protein
LLKPEAEVIVRTIADFPNPIDWTVNLRNIRIERLKFKKYLH